MKFTMALMLCFLGRSVVYACDACVQQQPRILKGLTHGSGPESRWDYLIISLAVGVVIVTLLLSVKFLLKPKEDDEKHIKRLVLEHDYS